MSAAPKIALVLEKGVMICNSVQIIFDWICSDDLSENVATHYLRALSQFEKLRGPNTPCHGLPQSWIGTGLVSQLYACGIGYNAKEPEISPSNKKYIDTAVHAFRSRDSLLLNIREDIRMFQGVLGNDKL